MRKSGKDTGSELRRKRDDRVVLHRLLFFLLILLLPVQLGRHWWPQWSYVLGLKIDYLSPTLYLTDVLVVGMLGLWGYEKVKIQKLKFKSIFKNLKRFVFPVSIFLFLLVNCFFAQNQAVAFYKSAKITEFVFIGFYIAKNSFSPLLITHCLLLATIYSSLIALAQFLKQSSLNGVFYWLGERTFSLSTPGIAKAIVGGRLVMRPYATFPHPNVLAGFVLVGLILTFPITNYSLLITKIIRRLVITLGIIAILISFSRSTWFVGLAVGLWALSLYLQPVVAKFISRSFRSLIIGVVSLFFVLCCLLFVVRLPFSTHEAIIQRFDLAKISLEMIRQYPLVGVGLGNFIVRLPDFWQAGGAIRFLQPVHNIYLLVAAELGLVGLLVLGWFLFLTYKRLLNCYIVELLDRKKKDFLNFPITHYSLLITLSAILLLGMADHYWFTLQQTQLLFSIILGLSWGGVRQTSRKGQG